MKSKKFNLYYLLSCIILLIASYYPLSMGVRIVVDMITDGSVAKENYPKYVIPYSPISVALIVGVLLMPLCIRLFKKLALLGGCCLSTAVFLVTELVFEQKIIVSTAETVTKLEAWQMAMCYVSPEMLEATAIEYKTQTAVEILMGEYNPAFKLHFYVISILLIVTVMNCLYGFGQMIVCGDKRRCRSLVLQSAATCAFLALCILACFTAFWRDGSIEVSPLSAVLMAVYFVLFGMTAGIFVGSFTLDKSRFISVCVPALTASLMALIMYAGEMILLNGHLYVLGDGVIFKGIPGIVLAPIDILIILTPGTVTAWLSVLLNKRKV